MNASTRITAIAVLLYSMTAPLGAGIPQGHPGGVSETAEFMHSTPPNTEPIELAENTGSTSNSSEESRAASNNEAQESASESGTDKNEQSADTKSKPLKPFVPSEEIAAEQAVDFPVDI